jgi:hypothetical protein
LGGNGGALQIGWLSEFAVGSRPRKSLSTAKSLEEQHLRATDLPDK